MIRIEGDIVIDGAVEDVLDYVVDERNEPMYNAQMRLAEKISDGPIGVGTKYRAEVVSGGRPVSMVIEFTQYVRPRRLASSTTVSSMDIAYTLTFEPVREGTRMRWSGEIEPHGMLRLMGPLVAWMGRRQELRIWTGLKGLLEGERAPAHQPGRNPIATGAPPPVHMAARGALAAEPERPGADGHSRPNVRIRWSARRSLTSARPPGVAIARGLTDSPPRRPEERQWPGCVQRKADEGVIRAGGSR